MIATTDTDNEHGWGYGLSTWILAAYTDSGETVLDLDDDPGMTAAALAMNRHLLRDAAADATVQLITARWPRPIDAVGDLDERHQLDAVAASLTLAGCLALMVIVPAPTQPFTLHTRTLLTAAFDAGLDHLLAVHGDAMATHSHNEPVYRCALIFRRPDHRDQQAPEQILPGRVET